MGRQWNTIIESLGPLSGGTMSITANLTDIEALLTTLQADVADGILPAPSTSGGTGPTIFTSTSYGTIATASTATRSVTIYNAGAGNLLVTLGTATTSTSSLTVSIGSGNYYETPANYTGLIGGIFQTAGTAYVTRIT